MITKDNKTIDDLCGAKIDVRKIRNPRLKQIVNNYKPKDGFLFIGLFGGSDNRKHEDHSEHSDYSGHPDSSDWATHDDNVSHTDRYYTYNDHSETYDDHTDHTDQPHSEHSEYSESQYHTDSNSPNYRR